MVGNYIERLQEDKFHASIEETIDYKLPVLQAHISTRNLMLQKIVNGKVTVFYLNTVTLNRPTTDEGFRLMNYAWQMLRAQNGLFLSNVIGETK